MANYTIRTLSDGLSDDKRVSEDYPHVAERLYQSTCELMQRAAPAETTVQLIDTDGETVMYETTITPEPDDSEVTHEYVTTVEGREAYRGQSLGDAIRAWAGVTHSMVNAHGSISLREWQHGAVVRDANVLDVTGGRVYLNPNIRTMPTSK